MTPPPPRAQPAAGLKAEPKREPKREPGARASKTPRRTRRFGRRLAAAALVVLAVVTVASLIALGDRLSLRFDTTAAGEHRLGARARTVLASLDGQHRLIVAVNASQADQRVFDRVEDVLAAMGESPNLEVGVIDTGSAQGLDQLSRLLATLAEADRPVTERDAATLASALDELSQAGVVLRRIAARLNSAANAVIATGPDEERLRTRLAQRAAATTARAEETERTAAQAGEGLSARTDAAGLIDTGAIARETRARLATLVNELDALATLARQDAASPLAPRAAQAQLAAVAAEAADRRDLLALAAEPVARIRPTDASRVAEALQRSEVILAIGPNRAAEAGTDAQLDQQLTQQPPRRAERVVAVDPESLLFPAEVLERVGVSAGAEAGQRAEELFTTALATLASPIKPIVVFTHAETEPFLIDNAGARAALLQQRLSALGIDTLEWPVILNTDPGVAAIDPTGLRPVVYVVMPPDSLQSAPTVNGQTEASLSGVRRTERLAEVVAGLLDDAKPVLLSLNPSILPASSETDPLAALAAPFGIAPDTGAVVLRPETSGARTLASPLALARGDGPPDSPAESTPAAAPLAAAVANLPTMVAFASPISLDPASGAAALLEIDDPGVWAEREWQFLWRTPPAQRPLLDPQPAPSATDDRDGPFVVAAAAERQTGTRRGRLVVVGSNGWFLDAVAAATVNEAGRSVPRFPGNRELFESSIAWLAGQDSLLASGSDARALPTVQPLEARERAALQWALTLGLPAGVLLLGVVYRFVRP